MFWIKANSFFFYQGFLSQTLTIHRTAREGKGRNHLLFHFTTSTCSRTLRHLFATLQARWLSRIFNRNVCVYQTAATWNLRSYRITIWLIDKWCNNCLFTWWVDSRFLLQLFNMGDWGIWTRINYHACITSKPTNHVG